jgi:site-specific recombinase XerD
MKPTDFSIHVTRFLTHYLAAQRNLSPNTIMAYRDVFTLLLRFCRDIQGIAPERLRIEQIDVSLVGSVFGLLGKRKTVRAYHTKPSSCSLARILPICSVGGAGAYASVPKNPRHSPAATRSSDGVGYLSKDDLAEILAQPDLRKRDGRRDAVLLSILYDTGARVQELVDLSVGDVRLDPPAQLRLMGKGRKMRAVPLMEPTVQLLRDHMHENHLDRHEQFDRPVFRNVRDQRLSRSGIRYILQKHVGKARAKRPSLNRTSPHTLRHTKGNAPVTEWCLA